MSEAKRPESRRRGPASRPGRGGGDSVAGRPRKSPAPVRGRNAARAPQEAVAKPLQQSIVASAEQRFEQRLGFTARRAAVLAAVVCVLTLTIAGPVRTFFAQRTEMHQLATTEAALRQQIADLEQQKGKLSDPAYIAAQARERLGFVLPGDIPYQVQLPPGAAAAPTEPGNAAVTSRNNDPWYTSLWHTIADAPHGPPAPAAAPDPTASPPASQPSAPKTPAPPGG
jgi:cell division protein FtsB